LSQVRFGVIGCGSMGAYLARQVGKVGPAARVVAACDIVEGKRVTLAEDLGAKPVECHEDLLKMDEVDAVIVATPNHLHHPHALDAARAGKHVFSEKPMALTVAHCTDMIGACRTAGVKLMVGQVLRYIGIFPVIKKAVDAGDIGVATAMFTARIQGPNWGSFSATWRDYFETTGGILFEVNVHELDFQRTILGNPIEVSAYGADYVSVAQWDYEDMYFVNARYPGGKMSHLSAGGCAPPGVCHCRGTVYGSEGALQFTTWDEALLQRFGEEERALKAEPGPDAYAQELGDFVTAVVEDTEPIIPGEEGRRSIAFAAAALESARTGKPVRPEA